MYTLSEILRGKPKQVEDDLRILRSFVEYRNGSDKMDYIILELEMKDRDGSVVHLFKAIKMYRIIKLPDMLRQSTKMMDIQSQIMASFWENKINFINIIARIEKCGQDTPIGLMQLYGVQGVAKTIEEAKHIADADFSGLTAALQGSYRTMEFRHLNHKEAEWLREKMANMKHIQVVRGIPTARKASSERSVKGMGNSDTDPTSEETSEQFAAGLADHEFIAMTLVSPIEYGVLESWLTQTSRKQTQWASIMQGTTSMNAGINIPIVFAANLGASMGESEGVSDTTTEGHSTNRSQSITEGTTVSQSRGFSEGTTISNSENFGESAGLSHSEGENMTHTVGHTEGTNASIGSNYSYSENESMGTNYSFGKNDSFSLGESLTTSEGMTVTDTQSSSDSNTSSFTTNQSMGHTYTDSVSQGTTTGTTRTHTEGSNVGINGSFSTTTGANVGIPGLGVSGSATVSVGGSAGWSESDSLAQQESTTNTTTQSTGLNFTEGTSRGSTYGHTVSQSQAIGQNRSLSSGITSSRSTGTSESWGENYSSGSGQSWGVNESYGRSASDSVSNSKGVNVSDGWNKGISYGQSRGVTNSVTETQSVSKSQSVSKGYTTGEGESWSRGIGRNSSVSNSLSSGLSTSMGIGASLGVGKTYQFIDSEIQNIVELLEFQKLRLKTAIHGGTGAFFTDMYIATETEEAKNAARTAAKFAWYDEAAMICPLQVLELDEDEAAHLLYHFNAFSACTRREMDKYGQLESYRYTTILNAPELTAYTHVIRLSDGGIFADIQNIPELAVPSEMKGEIYIGKILSGYRWSVENGYRTPFDYRIANDSLMHALISGGSRSGKTVTALRLVAEMANHIRRGPKQKRLRIIAMDPKEDWRKLAGFVEAERFRIYSMGDPNKFPFKLNPMKVPYGVDPEFHLDTLIDVFCRSYGLGIRSVTIMLDTMKSLYDREGVFDTDNPVEVSERSARITMADAYKLLNTKKENKEFGRDKADAVDKVLDRLSRFAWENGVLYKLYCQPDGMSIDEILGEDDVVVLESGKLQSNNMAFIFGFITASIYMFAKYCPDNFLADDQYETVLVVEEANRVLTGDTGDGDFSGGIQGQSIFEEMLDQAAGLGLFVFSVTQQPSLMPRSIVANSGLLFAGRMTMTDDIDLMMTALGREGRYDDRPIKKFFPKCPTGWFICKSSRTFDYKESEPILVQVDRLDVQKPTDEELMNMMLMRQIKKESKFAKNQLEETKSGLTI